MQLTREADPTAPTFSFLLRTEDECESVYVDAPSRVVWPWP